MCTTIYCGVYIPLSTTYPPAFITMTRWVSPALCYLSQQSSQPLYLVLCYYYIHIFRYITLYLVLSTTIIFIIYTIYCIYCTFSARRPSGFLYLVYAYIHSPIYCRYYILYPCIFRPTISRISYISYLISHILLYLVNPHISPLRPSRPYSMHNYPYITAYAYNPGACI